MAKRGPKIKTVNWTEFDKLCALQCSLREIAGWFNVSEDTIENIVKREKGIKFSEYFAQKKSHGKIALRRKQYETAMSGSVPLLIWLGKQYLGQSEKVERPDEENKTRPVRLIIENPKESENDPNL